MAAVTVASIRVTCLADITWLTLAETTIIPGCFRAGSSRFATFGGSANTPFNTIQLVGLPQQGWAPYNMTGAGSFAPWVAGTPGAFMPANSTGLFTVSASTPMVIDSTQTVSILMDYPETQPWNAGGTRTLPLSFDMYDINNQTVGKINAYDVLAGGYAFIVSPASYVAPTNPPQRTPIIVCNHNRQLPSFGQVPSSY